MTSILAEGGSELERYDESLTLTESEGLKRDQAEFKPRPSDQLKI